MQKITNHTIPGAKERPILLDAIWKADGQKKPVVIFSHGYKGFKDFGAWNIISEQFAEAGIIFVKFNYSHNGGTVEQPIDFPDLEAFGRNTFSMELDELGLIIDWVINDDDIPASEKDTSKICLIGHSRGGGISILRSGQDERVAGTISWAGISDIEARFPKGEVLEAWKKAGVSYIENARTKQKMPHYFSFYEDFVANKERLNIQKSAQAIQHPFLIIHGDQDTSVLPIEAQAIHLWNPQSQLHWIKGADHGFGVKHPHEGGTLPEAMQEVVDTSIAFVKAI